LVIEHARPHRLKDKVEASYAQGICSKSDGAS
jgi:hypothetical protein